MIAWLSDELSGRGAAAVAVPAGAPVAPPAPALRLLDLALSALVLAALALPLAALAALCGGFTRQRLLGLQGVPFQRLGLALPSGLRGRLAASLGAGDWPVLLNILRGDMAWVGPRARAQGEAFESACLGVRPGLVNPWFIRRRTAVDFGTEEQADLGYLARRGLQHDLGLLLRGALVAALPAATGRLVPERVVVGDVAFHNVDMTQALARLSGFLDGTGTAQVSFVNPACVNIAASNRAYRRVLARANLVLPDGIGIKIGTALLGTPLKQNVNGTDLFPRLCDLLQARAASVFLLGGGPRVAEAVAAQMAARWPGVRVVGARHGFFSVAEEGRVVAEVRASGADVLLVARGVPGQDLFIDRYLPQLGVKVALGVGGLFDFVSGRISRAPVWMRETGLEWMWRLRQEPGRMWRRYLVGNITFLARVVMQRATLRKRWIDVLSLPKATLSAKTETRAVRAVIFATPRPAADMPLAADFPTALLPLGHQSLIEHLLANLAQAKVHDVDLVVSDRPHELRALLGDGSRWGLRLRWHLAKDPAHAYAVLDQATLRDSGHIVIGHADRCPSVAALQALVSAEQWLMDTQGEFGPQWAGWGSLSPSRLSVRCAELGRAALGLQGAVLGLRVRVVEPADGLPLYSAEQVLAAQPGASGELAPQDVPLSWIRTPWGAMSPLAVVNRGATLVGPVLVGPGCIVSRGAQVGPHVVLSRDIVVSKGTRVENSLVLPGAYIGAGLDLTQCVVNGARVRHLALDVEARLPEADALILSLGQETVAASSWAGRAAAAAALVVAGPVLLGHVACRWFSGRGPDWALREAVLGRPEGAQRLITINLRCAHHGAGAGSSAWARAAGLIDVAAGRRSWFGMRPRSRGQWYALRPEWQQMLTGRAIGLFHAPAWSDDSPLLAEACAAADVFASVLSPARRLGLAWQALRRVGASMG
jgi:N-acetylglucosaminyldiphosphoundecaprenol N-acetyl-beta-D-mannosaminyltransferase